ncbi:ABC transporter family substrate-binding protein [Pseudonocardia kongjuensis]|uniref:ABC transporter family substrate-binding protein n=1 Tax=Pseudonocardia kongjuensis TaxID=102227 RepID=A0ABN1Y125_9PSEU
MPGPLPGPRPGPMLTAALSALALVLTACGAGAGTGEVRTGAELSAVPAFNEQPYENVRDGGTVTLPLRSDLNPQFNRHQGDTTLDTLTVWRWYNPVLVTFTPQGEPRFNPDYLVSAVDERIGDDTRITYTINPRAVFNDGTPIDWRAFEATWRARNGRDTAYIAQSTDGYDRIASVTRGADDRQVVVTFDGVHAWWPGLFPELVHPAVAADPAVFNQGYLNEPHPEWGAGPYTVAAHDRQNSTITFERNPAWWGRPGKLDRVTLVQMEPTAKINAFRNGQLDATEAESADLLAQARSAPGADVRISARTASFLLTVNSAAPLLGDPGVRRAIMQGVDRGQLVDIAFQGMDYTEEPLGSLMLKPYQEGYRDNLSAVVDGGPEAAAEGLDALGWVPGPDGIRVKDGTPLSITFVQTGDTPASRAAAGALVAMMRAIGVDLQVRQVPAADFSSVLANKEFDLLISGFMSVDPYGIAGICQLYCSTSQLNNSGTGTPELDAQLQRVATLATPAEQFAAANAAEQKALGSYGLLPLYSGPETWVTRADLANFGASLFHRALPETIGRTG